MTDIQHLAWPFRLAGRRLGVVEQDGLEDVTQSVRSYLATARGDRPLSPGFGLVDPTFGPGVNTALLESEIMAAEDGRAVVSIAAAGPDALGYQSVVVTVDLAE